MSRNRRASVKTRTVTKRRCTKFKTYRLRRTQPYEVNLGKLTVVAGGNGQGKTTIADAIAYAFCGTPFWGEKSCDRLQNPEDSATDQISMKENMDPLTGSKNK